MSRLLLPDGPWFDWRSGEKFEGQRCVARRVDLETLSLDVRIGAICSLDPARQFTAQTASGPTTLRIQPGGNGAFTLYDDDGRSLGYRDGSDARTTRIKFRWDDAKRALTIPADMRMKRWLGGVRAFCG